MTNKQYEQLKKVIQKAVPEIMEFEMGCKLKNKQNQKNDFVIIKQQGNSHLFLVFNPMLLHCQEFGEGYITLNFKILGRPIKLEDVLIASRKGLAIDNEGEFITLLIIDGQEVPHWENKFWCLNKDLDWHWENKKEIVKFLYNLICK